MIVEIVDFERSVPFTTPKRKKERKKEKKNVWERGSSKISSHSPGFLETVHEPRRNEKSVMAEVVGRAWCISRYIATTTPWCVHFRR